MSTSVSDAAKCYACEKPLDAEAAEDGHCHGCGSYFCNDVDCPASEHELEVPFGRHNPQAHLGEDS